MQSRDAAEYFLEETIPFRDQRGVARRPKRGVFLFAYVVTRHVHVTQKSVPSCVIEVRYNRRKNLLAIDTRNGQTTRTLLGQTTLCGMKVRAFEPRGKASSVGIVRDIDSTLSDSAILGVLRSTVGIRNVRRIGKSTTIRVEFASPTLPEHVCVGLVRHGVDLYVNNPIQCHRCGLFGHVAAVCKRSLTCLRCAQPHATTECKGSSTLCVNCKKPHETTSQQCPFWQAERSVCRYRCENNVSFAEARAQVDKRTAERAAPRAEAATEMVVLTEKLQRRRRHSRRRKAEQPVADKQDPSSSLVAEAPKPMDTEPPPKEAPVLVSSGENIGRQSYKAALQNKPPSSSPPVQAGPVLPATQAPQSVGQEAIPSLPNPSTLTSSLASCAPIWQGLSLDRLSSCYVSVTASYSCTSSSTISSICLVINSMHT
ncbi:hypothetical protein HPB47_018918 [Ixodes persulcatus]|uniref:Uncharacterized protein n=1 Tax=Ixodes persulcatus TaxID=34615 RepID=A0AC60QKD0_IXOPE|nr:hypothetical protein HPB47_018918 [Ixodes persulcatus]